MKASEEFKNCLDNIDWKYMDIHSGNSQSTSNSLFVFKFIKEFLIKEDDFKFAEIDRLFLLSKSFLYLKTSELPKESRDILSELEKKIDFILVENVEIFKTEEILKSLSNNRYNYLIIDDYRPDEEYLENRIDAFDKVVEFCKTFKIKIISSTNKSRVKKNDYRTFQADVFVESFYDIHDSSYEIRSVLNKSVFNFRL